MSEFCKMTLTGVTQALSSVGGTWRVAVNLSVSG